MSQYKKRCCHHRLIRLTHEYHEGIRKITEKHLALLEELRITGHKRFDDIRKRIRKEQWSDEKLIQELERLDKWGDKEAACIKSQCDKEIEEFKKAYYKRQVPLDQTIH